MNSIANINPADSQTPFDAAVVMTTTGRASLIRAARSVFAQTSKGRIQLLIGMDKAVHGPMPYAELHAECPAHCHVTLLDLGYSTSSRHGGLYRAHDGGALRTILTYAANSRYVCYLDDDNWMAEAHISTLLCAIDNNDWAYSYRWFVDPETATPLCVDEWESIGPDRGYFNYDFGGWVDPNSLMIDKLRCQRAIDLWTAPLPRDVTRMSADRNVFAALRANHRCAATGLATSFYVISPTDVLHERRMGWIASK